MRTMFPIVNFCFFGLTYFEYKSEVLKAHLFEEYIQNRAQELVADNEYIFQHEDFKRFIWWFEDLKETLTRVHRQANNHTASDFADSELIPKISLRDTLVERE